MRTESEVESDRHNLMRTIRDSSTLTSRNSMAVPDDLLKGMPAEWVDGMAEDSLCITEATVSSGETSNMNSPPCMTTHLRFSASC